QGIWWRGSWLGRRGGFNSASAWPGGEVLVKRPARVRVVLRLFENVPSFVRMALPEHPEAILKAEIILHLHSRRGRIELERVFAAQCPARIVAVEQPLA